MKKEISPWLIIQNHPDYPKDSMNNMEVYAVYWTNSWGRKTSSSMMKSKENAVAVARGLQAKGRQDVCVKRLFIGGFV